MLSPLFSPEAAKGNAALARCQEATTLPARAQRPALTSDALAFVLLAVRHAGLVRVDRVFVPGVTRRTPDRATSRPGASVPWLKHPLHLNRQNTLGRRYAETPIGQTLKPLRNPLTLVDLHQRQLAAAQDIPQPLHSAICSHAVRLLRWAKPDNSCAI